MRKPFKKAQVQFATEKIVRKSEGMIRKNEILQEFKDWYRRNYGNNDVNGKEIVEYMDAKYGKNKRGRWYNVEINYDNDDYDDYDDNDDKSI